MNNPIPSAPPYLGTLPEGWTGGEARQKWWRGRYGTLYTLRKPCEQCQREMRIDVTGKAIEGKAKNAGLRMKRCRDCRAASRTGVGLSRPNVIGSSLSVPTPKTDDGLRAVNATMKEELEGLYAQLKDVREKLAQYEQPKMPWEG